MPYAALVTSRLSSRSQPLISLCWCAPEARAVPFSAVFWEHDEYDSQGRLLAHYFSFEQVNDLGERQTGWRKFDSHGHLVSEDDDLQYAPGVSAVIRNRDGNAPWQ